MKLEMVRKILENSEMKLFTERGSVRAIGNGKLYINGGTMKEGGADIPIGENTVIEFGDDYLSIYFFNGNVHRVNWNNPFYVGMVATEMYNLRTENINELRYYEWK